ncbi:MAG TPA: KpsF/GutQ family sugar-phosphate isomerase [Dissulfurispiraceae bacterium]|nr:KpsF/GutQ family sugar-phosphate isomerase [Dissulfurispiraceae bacterium]
MAINDCTNNDSLSVAKRVLRIEADAVSGLIDKINGDFDRAVDIIYQAKGRVVVTGMGKSGIIGKKIAATLASTGTPAFFLHPAEASHGDLGMVTARDVIIAISNSGETDEIIQLIPFLKRFDVAVVSLTGNASSTLARSADVSLDISVTEEACPLGITPTASTTAALAMGDAIAVALLVKRGFKQEDFASFHPAGSLGKKLFVRVKDLMHAGESLPLIASAMPVMEAVMEISSKRLGIAIVAASDGKILGVITDGDVRRGIQKWGKEFFDMKSDEVMSRNPRLISGEDLAAKALSMMQTYSITSLIVPDSEGRAVGIIHLHDILKKGIV